MLRFKKTQGKTKQLSDSEGNQVDIMTLGITVSLWNPGTETDHFTGKTGAKGMKPGVWFSVAPRIHGFGKYAVVHKKLALGEAEESVCRTSGY